MSGSGDGNVNVTWTADTAPFDAAMAASSQAAKAAFDSVGSAATSASTKVSASMAELQKSLATAKAQFVQLGPAAQGAISQVITALEAQIVALKADAAAATEAAAAIAKVGEASSASTLQEFINSSVGLDRSMISASNSAKVFAEALATQGVSATELANANANLGRSVTQLTGPQFFGAFERQFPGIKSGFISAAGSAKVFEDALAAQGSRIAPLSSTITNLQNSYTTLGSKVRTLSGPEFFGVFERQFPGIRTNVLSAAESAKVFEQAMEQGGQAAGRFGTLTSNATRELIVLGNEAMAGRFSRMPGSFMVLASNIGNVTNAFLGMAAGIGIATFAMVELIAYMNRLTAQQREIQAAGAFFNPQINVEALNKIMEALHKLPDVTRADAAATVAEFARMPGLTEPFLVAITDNIQVFADAMGQKVPQAAKTLASAFGEPTARGREFLQSINATTRQLADFDAAQNAAGRRSVMLSALEEKLTAALNTAAEKAREESKAFDQSLKEMGSQVNETGNFVQQFGARVDNIQTAKSVANIEHLRAAIKSLNDIERTPGGAGGGASWAAKQSEQLLELQNKVAAGAKTRNQLEQATSKAAVDFWANAAKQEGITDAQRTEALANANRARLSLMKEEISGNATAAHQGLMAQIASISAQQAAVKNDFAQWKSLQEQKLSVIRGAVGEQTALYQNALRELNAAETQHANQSNIIALRAIQNQEALDNKAVATRREILDAEVARRIITRSEEFQQLRSLVTQQDEANLESLNNLIKTLQEGTAAYASAMNMRSQLSAKLVEDIAKYNSQIAQADAKAATGAEKAWSDAANKIGSSFENEMGEFVAGQQTAGQAAQRVVTATVQAFVTGAIKMAAQWAVSQAAMATSSQVTQNAVAVAQASGGTGFFALLSKQLAALTGNESSQVAAVTAGESAKMAARTTASAAGRAVQAAEGSKIIVSDAAKAYAGAYSAVAGIPYIGPILAPAAGAVAFAAVSAYGALASLDVGTMNVPQDMPAYLHRGEMVVPATFATGIRSAMGAMGGSSSSSNSPLSLSYSPTINAGGSGSGGMSYGQISQMLAASQGQLVTLIINTMRNGNLMLPGRGIGT